MVVVQPEGRAELTSRGAAGGGGEEIRSRVRSEDPFATPAAERDPARRLRGRLVAPVTVWTAGEGRLRAGLTVSSLLVAEGEPPVVLGLIGPLTDLFEVLTTTGAFAVHVLEEGDRRLADSFAGAHPGPGGPFEGLDVEDSPWGPLLPGTRTTIGCRLAGTATAGWFELVRGTVEELRLAPGRRPMAWLAGRYRGLRADESR